MLLAWLFTCLISFKTEAALALLTNQGTVLIEKYQEEEQWVIDEFLIRPGKIQERRAHRVFQYEFQALNHIKSLKLSGRATKKPTKITVREENAVPIWTVKNSWNEDWEKKYSQWVADNFDANFFVRYQLATDCADVAYTMRWIFSRINSLPAAGTLAGSKKVITQDDGAAAWANLPTHSDWSQDTRFRTALKWLLNNVYTRTLWEDAYPLAISRDTIRPGVINLLGGHTLLLNQLIDNGRDVPITFLSSTVPQAVRSLYLNVFLDSDSIPKEAGGLFQFRWPVKTAQGWHLTAKDQMPSYSLEQYSWKEWCKEKSFALCVYQKLNLSFKPKTAVESIVLSLEESLRLREQIVTDGIVACASMDCSLGTVGYEDWSTPSRDKRLNDSYSSSSMLASSLGQLDEEALSIWQKWKSDSPSLMNRSREDWFSLMQQKLVSYDPRDSLESRWGSSTKGIQESVKRRWDVFELLRDRMIQEAQSCREDQALCSIGTSEYKRLSSLEIDLEMRSLASGYSTYCAYNPCLPDLLNTIEPLWFMRPQPWLSTQERQGNTVARIKSKVFYGAGTLSETLSGLLIINGSKLYDPKTNITSSQDGVFYHVTSRGMLLRQDGAGTWLERGGNFLQIDKNSGSSLAYGIQLLGPDSILISESNEFERKLRIVKVSNGGRLWEGFGTATFVIGLPFLIVRDIESKIIDISNGEETTFPLISENMWEVRVMAKLAPHHYMLQAMNYVEQEGTSTIIFEVTDGSLSVVESELVYAETYLLSNKQLIIKNNKVFIWELNESQPRIYEEILGRSTLSRKQLLLQTAKGIKLLSENTQGLQEFLNLPSEQLRIIGHHNNELSFIDSKGFHQIDQQGREVIPTQLLEGKGYCNSSATYTICSGESEIKFSALESQNLSKIEGIVEGVPFYITPETGYYEEAGLVFKGTLVRPSNNVLIYRMQ